MTVVTLDLAPIRTLWRDLCGVPHGFDGPGVVVADVDDHRAAPVGWTAVVQIGDAAVVAGPGATSRASRLGGVDPASLVDPGLAGAFLGPFHDTLGPAHLFYGAPVHTPRHPVDGPIRSDDPRVLAILADADEAERDECGIEGVTSGVWLAYDDDGEPGAVCGWTAWPHATAHLSVLTAASRRGRGLGRSAAVVAIAEAVDHGLMPQWRAAAWNTSSIGLAARLGLTPVGHQLSVRLA